MDVTAIMSEHCTHALVKPEVNPIFPVSSSAEQAQRRLGVATSSSSSRTWHGKTVKEIELKAVFVVVSTVGD